VSGPADYAQLGLPFARRSDTSRAAAEAARDRAPFDRGRIYAAIVAAGARGLTDEELEESTGLKGNTVRPRRGELAGQGKAGRAWPRLIEPAGERPTSSGRHATVWAAVGRKGVSDAGSVE
jgi:hypothetical protein